MKKVFLFLFIALVLKGYAQVGGDGVYKFLHQTHSARIAALGGINVSVFNGDLNFAEENPALLNEQMNKKVVLNYLNYFAGINYGYAGYADNIKKAGNFSFGIRYTNYGTFTAADPTGIKTGNFKAADYAFSIIWSKQLFKNIRGGINIKPVYSHLESYTSFGIVFDVGLSYIIPERNFAASLVLKNVGSQIKPYYSGHYEKVPFDIQAGISKKLAHAPFRINITAHHLHKWELRYEKPEKVTQISFAETPEDKNKGKQFTNFLDNGMRHLIIGVDLIPLKSFYASISYNYQRFQEMRLIDKSGFTGFAWGFGLTLKKAGFSFGRSRYHMAGGANYFSVYVNISEFGKRKRVEVN